MRSISPIPLAAVSLGRVGIPRPSVPLVSAATGFNNVVKSPTLFLDGEAGVERVIIGGGASSVSTTNDIGGSGGTTIINNHTSQRTGTEAMGSIT
jgi:hypothetical protein